MRILIFNWRDIKNPEAGGAEIYLHEIFKRIAQKGNEVVLISSKFNGCKKTEFIDGIKVKRIGNRFNFNFVSAFYYLIKLRKDKFDIVIDDISKIPLCTPLYIKRPLIAMVYHLHGRTLFRILPPFISHYVYLSERLPLPFYKTKKIISVSESTKKELIQFGIPAGNITIIYPGLNNGIRLNQNIYYEKSEYPLILYLGRIKAYKQLDHLIKAFKIVRNEVENSKLIIAGKGDKKPLKNLVVKLRIDSSVEFYNEVTEEEKLRLLHQAWVFVSPSMKEGWGITVTEANASGTPAIAYDVPGLRDSIKHNYNGLLVEDGNKKALAGAIKKVLKDSKLRNILGKNALEWSGQFSWDKSAIEFMDILQNGIDNLSIKAIGNPYTDRKVEQRKLFLIRNFILKDSHYNKILDLGCGNGEYLSHLKNDQNFVVGLDIDEDLTKISKSKGFDVILARVEQLPFKDNSFDYVWASEVVEHTPTFAVLDEIERIVSKKIILILPNPIFPFFKWDPTHVLSYSVSSLKKFLDNRTKDYKWSYSVRGLGFNEFIPTKIIKLFTLILTWFIPWLSPTITVIGVNNSNRQNNDKKIVNLIAYSVIEAATLSGGYRIAIELIRRWSYNTNLIFYIYTTKEGKKLFEKYIQDNPRIVYKIIWSPSFITRYGFEHSFITSILYVFLALLGLIKTLFLNEKKLILVYSTTPFLPDILPALATKFNSKNAKWLVAHAMFSPNPFKGGFSGTKKIKIPNLRDIGFYLNERLTYPLFKKFADFISETNELDRQRCIKEGVSSERVFVIRGGVDLNLYQKICEPKEKEYEAVFIGRLHPQKGPLELIDMWRLVCKKKKNFKLAIIGNGPLELDVKKRIIKYGLQKNIFPFGFLDGIEKIKIIKDSKIVLHPALYDSGGMAACEAMACGLPGISFDLDSLKEYYPKGMLKIPCFDFFAFAEGILKLLSDKQLFEKTRNDAVEFAKDWDWEIVADEVMKKLSLQ